MMMINAILKVLESEHQPSLIVHQSSLEALNTHYSPRL